MRGLWDRLMGLKPPRTRRLTHVSGGKNSLSHHAAPRSRLRHPLTLLAMGVLLTVLFAVILLPREFGLRHVAGALLLAAVLNTLFILHLLAFRRNVLASRAKVSLICILATIVFGIAVLRSPGWPPYLIPISAATIVLSVVFSRRFALETSWMLLLCTGVILYIGGRMGFEEVVRTTVVLAAGMLVAVLTTGRIRTRSKIIQVGLLIGVVHVLVIAAMLLAGPAGGVDDGRTALQHLFWGLAHGVLVGFVVSGTLPLIEYLFRISTDISLLELANISQQTVLRRLLLAAPGTYNHSFVVGMLSEEAAEAIGANPLLARVGGYYHDIGKMLKPPYFGENEAVPGLHHRPLSPTMSTLIIKAHVKDGVELARYHDLPGPIVDIIEQHHGTTCVEYFFEEARKRAKKGERVEDSLFRYEGPKPQSKEAGIIMLADAVEAATRSLSDPTPARVETTIKKISAKKLADEQLDACGLTLRDVRRIEESFVRVLAGIFHRRPRYPEIVGTREPTVGAEEAPPVELYPG